MDYEIINYSDIDIEKPSKEFTHFERKVQQKKLKLDNPNVKPQQVFEGYKKTYTKCNSCKKCNNKKKNKKRNKKPNKVY
jgi:hypothetical protein